MTRKNISILGAVGLLLSFIPFESAHAVASFARRYNTDCSMCHTMIPRLNPTGHKFRRMGYQMPAEFDEKEAEISWEDLAKLTNYLSVRGRAGGLYTRQSGVNTFSFSAAGAPPPDATLFYTGRASRNLSFFYEFAFDPDAAAVEVGQMMFHGGDSDRFFFARAGKFHDFGKVGFGGLDRGITLTGAQVFSQRINGYRPFMDVIGIEGGYTWGDFTGLVQVNNGITGAGHEVGGEIDPNNHKDIGLLLEYLIPGHDASVSLLYVYGQAPVPENNAGAAVAGAANTQYHRLYAFADYTIEPVGLKPIIGGGFGSDNQFVSGIGTATAALVSASRSSSWFTFAELDQRITNNLYGVARFDYYDPTNQAEATSATARTWAGTGGLVWSFQKYLRLAGEYSVKDNSFQNALHNVKAEVQMNF